MTKRGLHKYIDDLIEGRRPRPFPPDEFEAAQLRFAIAMRATQDHEPRAEFIAELGNRIAEQFADEPAPQKNSSTTRRQVIVGTSAAAGAAVVAVSVDRLIGALPDGSSTEAGSHVVPDDGSWQPVARSTDVVPGDMRKFDLGTVTGFVRRVGDRVEAVSGVCTHQGCKLWFDRGDDSLHCPCHTTSFAPTGDVLTHQLPISPKPLPHFEARERDGVIEVLAPQPPSEPG